MRTILHPRKLTLNVFTDDEYRVFLKALGARIKQLRKEKGLEMRDIMISTGYYDAQWRKYEAGGSLNVSSLMKVAEGLNVSLAELLDGLAEWPTLSVSQIQAKRNATTPSKEKPKARRKTKVA